MVRSDPFVVKVDEQVVGTAELGPVTVFVCGKKPQSCSSCGAASVGGCQAELRGSKAGQQCGRHLCARCNEGSRQAPLCGPHARIARGR